MSEPGHILIAEGEPHFAGILALVLEAEDREVIIRDRADSALDYLKGHSPALAIINYELQDRSGLELARDLRRRYPASQTPIILTCSTHRRPTPQIQTALHALGIDLFLAKPFSVLDLPRQVREVLERRATADPDGAAEHQTLIEQLGFPADALPDPDSLQLITQVWAARRTGVLRSPAEPDWATMEDGEPVDPGSLRFVARALFAPGASFHEVANLIEGERCELGPSLWEAALRLADPSVVMRALDQGLLVTSLSEQARRLPLDLNTATVLGAQDSQRSLSELLQALLIEPSAISRPIAGLLTLGLVYLNPLAAPARPASKPRRRRARLPAGPLPLRPAEAPRAPRRTRGGMDPAVQEAFLHKERARLESTGDWSLLGIAATDDPRRVEAAVKRLNDRYISIRADSNATAAARSHAGVFQGWTQEAAKRIRAGHPRDAGAPGDRRSDEDVLFEAGLQAALSENWERALRCFRTARNLKIDSARNLAWMGWATHHVAADAGAREEALELLQLADSFDPTHPDGQYFLAALEARSGSPQVAQARLGRLLARHPGRDDARRLLTELRLMGPKAPSAGALRPDDEGSGGALG